VDLFVEGGSRAVTHRAVAAAAGLPAATTTYYFETIDDLLREALHHHIEQWIATMEGYTVTDPSAVMAVAARDSADQVVAAVFAQRPPETALRELQVILGAARDPQLRPAAVKALSASMDVLSSLLAHAGVEEPQGLAEDFMAVIAGVALRRSAGVHSDADEAAAMLRALRGLLVAHLVGEDVARDALLRFREGVSGRSDGSR